MEVPKELKRQIITAITELGENAATIKAIEKHVPLERHALSKYLHLMKRDGYLDYNKVGKAKLWTINRAPLKTLFKALPENMSFTEKMLFDIISNMPSGIMLMDTDYNILFMDDILVKKYGDLTGKKMYSEIFDFENPLPLRGIIKVIHEEQKKATLRQKDKFQNILRMRVSRLYLPDDSIAVLIIIDDITKRHRELKEVRRGKVLSHTLIETSESLLVTTDTFHRVHDMSDALRSMLGLTQVKDTNFLELIENKEEFLAAYQETMKTERPQQVVVRFRNKELKGKIFPASDDEAVIGLLYRLQPA